MKRLLILAALAAALLSGSCIFETEEYEITVRNKCDHDIKLALSTTYEKGILSRGPPLTTIKRGSSQVFTVDFGSYYVYIESDYTIWIQSPVDSDDSYTFYSDGTLTVSGSGYYWFTFDGTWIRPNR